MSRQKFWWMSKSPDMDVRTQLSNITSSSFIWPQLVVDIRGEAAEEGAKSFDFPVFIRVDCIVFWFCLRFYLCFSLQQKMSDLDTNIPGSRQVRRKVDGVTHLVSVLSFSPSCVIFPCRRWIFQLLQHVFTFPLRRCAVLLEVICTQNKPNNQKHLDLKLHVLNWARCWVQSQ